MYLIYLLVLSSLLSAHCLFVQTPRRPAAQSQKSKNEARETEALEAQRRAFAVSIIRSLSEEALSYNDLALRARVLARSADILWEADPDGARMLLRRAWEAAEKADAPEVVEPSKDAGPVMVIAQRRRGEGDSRGEVLNIAARRDRALGEQLLAKLIEAAGKANEQTTQTAQRNDSWTTTEEASKRLTFAQWLLYQNEPEKAFEFAAPALDRVNEAAISFLSQLRLVKPDLADKQFMLLLARAEIDPAADANTVSGLSSYAFTPGLYVIFTSGGGSQATSASEALAAPNLPSNVRSSFFRTAASILLRPRPAADQDFTSAGLIGKYMVIKRLLPLFEQYAPDTAVALQSQLTALAEQVSDSVTDDDDFIMTQGIAREENSRTVLDSLQERIDKAKSERARDQIYADAAAILAAEGNTAAQDIVDKIDNSYSRKMARHYVDISLVRVALTKRDVTAALRFAKADTLTHAERTWTFLQVGRLLMDSDRTRALELLEDALAEARRIDADDDHRVILTIGIAKEFLAADNVRSWEVAAEAIKAANAVEDFSGEANDLKVALITSSGLKLIDLDTSTLSLTALVSALAKQDLTRASDLPKSLKYEAPRAVATLAVATVAMAKVRDKK